MSAAWRLPAYLPSGGPGAGSIEAGGLRQPLDHQPSWLRVATGIETEIVSGMHPSGHLLPSRKELAARYCAGYSTVRRALDRLAREGRVVRSGRGHRVFSAATGAPYGSAVGLVYYCNPGEVISAFSPRTEDLHRYLEDEIEGFIKERASTARARS